MPLETPSLTLRAYLSFNNRPWHTRGWGVAERALALEVLSHGQAAYPLVHRWLTALPIGKFYTVDSAGVATEVRTADHPLQRRAVVRTLKASTFSLGIDRTRVVHLYSNCIKRILSAFESAGTRLLDWLVGWLVD